jgi:hypothetical protein
MVILIHILNIFTTNLMLKLLQMHSRKNKTFIKHMFLHTVKYLTHEYLTVYKNSFLIKVLFSGECI